MDIELVRMLISRQHFEQTSCAATPDHCRPHLDVSHIHLAGNSSFELSVLAAICFWLDRTATAGALVQIYWIEKGVNKVTGFR